MTVSRDEADHLAQRVSEARKVGIGRRDAAERRADRWYRRYMEKAAELREARATIDDQAATIDELADKLYERSGA